MLPDNFVMLLSTTTPNKIVYGAFTQLEDAKAQRFVTYQESRIPFIYGDEEGGNLYYRLTSLPLPMPADILGFRIIEALTMTYPASLPPGREGEGGKYVEGEAVLDVLTGEIVGGKDEAAEAKAEAAKRAEEAKKVTSTAAWKTAKGEGSKGSKSTTGDDDLNEYTIEQLKDIADEEGADLSGATRKDEIIKAIKDNRKK
jgi:hypothetical protein